jgi:hypothetical protein
MRRATAFAIALLFALSTAPHLLAAAKTTGTLTGVAQTSAGQALGSHTVQVRSVQSGVIVGSARTTTAGSFAFDLAPGSYVVEVVDAQGKIIGASSIATVAESTTASVSVTGNSTALVGGAISTPLLLLLIAAGGAGAVGIYAATKEDASPSR